MSEALRIGVVVEGHGEREAVPLLLRRIVYESCPQANVVIGEPIRHPRGRLLKEEGLKRAIELAAIKVGSGGYIVVVIDADDDCPKDLAPVLAGWIRDARSDVSSTCVMANREFEAWFLAGLDSLRGRRGLGLEVEPPDDPEDVPNPKAFLDRLMSGGYSETLDQPALAAVLDYKAAAERSRSLTKLVKDVTGFVTTRWPNSTSSGAAPGSPRGPCTTT